MRTYWLSYPRGFANEYTVGLATTSGAAVEYDGRGHTRIPRPEALVAARRKGNDATEMFVSHEIDGQPAYREDWLAAVLGT